MDEVDGLYAFGYRRLPAAGKYQPRDDAFSACPYHPTFDDSADRATRDHVAQGISGDSVAIGQRQRPGIAGISRAAEDVPADLEFVQAALPRQAWPDARKGL